MADRRSPAEKELSQQRKAQVIEWRRDGMTFEEIGRRLNPDAPLTRQAAHKIYTTALQEIPAQSIGEYRAEQEERLDELRRRAYDVLWREHVTVSQGRVVVDPDTGGPIVDDAPRLRAIETVLKIEERLARLRGIDVPTRAQVEGSLQVRYVVEGVDPGEALT